MSYLFSGRFWKGTAERAIKTLAQGCAAFLMADNFNVVTADWEAFFYIAVVPALASVLTSIGSGAIPAGTDNSPSLVEGV